MAKTLKYIDAGCLRVAALYDRRAPRDNPKQRAAKHQASSEAQRRMNRIYSYQKLELMLAANFPRAGSAEVCVLTFDDEHLPKSRAEVQRHMRYFNRLLRDARRAAGLPDPVVFWAIEALTAASGRWHVHAVIDRTGEDYAMIRRCWRYGSEVSCEKLRVDGEKNHESLAKYMTKELREAQEYDSKPGLHGWSCTRNARRPEVETVTVPDSYRLDVPAGATVLIDEQRVTEWASWRVLKIRYDGSPAPFPKAKRRRRRR